MITIDSIIRDTEQLLTDAENDDMWLFHIGKMNARERRAHIAYMDGLREALVVAHVSKIDPDYLSPSGKLGVL